MFRPLHLSPEGLWKIPLKSHIVVGSVSSFLELQYPHPFVLCYCDIEAQSQLSDFRSQCAGVPWFKHQRFLQHCLHQVPSP